MNPIICDTHHFGEHQLWITKYLEWIFFNKHGSHRSWWRINTLRPRQTGCHFADDIFKSIFLNENVWIPIKISLKFAPKGPINNNPSLVQIIVWRRPGAKPLFEPMMGSLLTHICVTRPQWVNSYQGLDILRIFLWNCRQAHWWLVTLFKVNWPGAVRHWAIIWAKVDPDLCQNMVSLGYNELKPIVA